MGDVTALFGGAFDPPHLGHVELVRAAKAHFRPARLIVLVVADPGHKRVATSAEDRLALARAAFPDDDVRIDRHARTVDLLRTGEWVEPLLLIGADELATFLDWKEPQEVLRLARLGVAKRPGFEQDQLEAVLARLERPERVEFFEIHPHALASTELRTGSPVAGAVPPAVEALIRERELYRS